MLEVLLGIFEITNRFLAQVAEPRPGIRSGHIEGSKNIPFKKCLNDDNTFKSTEELEKVFAECDSSKIQVFTCGSGVTAAVLYVA
jgi:thiosulfate/3-mercaptopyruvate sulfurtransferase